MQITLRLRDSLHSKVRERAKAVKCSVNSYVVQLIESDLQLPESRVPAETPAAKKSPVMVDAEALLAWSLEHQGDQPSSETIMEEFGWTERMILPRRTLFKALYRKDRRVKEVREKLTRRIFDGLNELKDDEEQIYDYETHNLDGKLNISKKYFAAVLKDLKERGAIDLYRNHLHGKNVIRTVGLPCREMECSGLMAKLEEPTSYRCVKCGMEWNFGSQLLEFLRTSEKDRKFGLKEVAEHFKVSRKRLEEALSILLDKGLLIKDQSGLRPKPEL